jgi:hypothetical protein
VFHGTIALNAVLIENTLRIGSAWLPRHVSRPGQLATAGAIFQKTSPWDGMVRAPTLAINRCCIR